MSKASLKNKVDSIRRTLKNQGIEVDSPIIESKIFELYPDFEDEWSSDARTEVIKALVKDLQPSELAIVETEIQSPVTEEIDIDEIAEPVNTLAVTDDDKRAMALQRSEELGITLTDAEINSIADSVEVCGESLDDLLNELESTLIAYIDHKTKLNNRKIDTTLDKVGDYAEQKLTENSQHLSTRLKSLGGKLEAVAEQNKSRVKTVLSRFAISSGN
jgi:hypothetical protein